MRKEGTIVRWDDAKGFGFIRSGDVAQDVFVHVRDCRLAEPPRPGLRVTFEQIHVGGKGPRAVAVRPLGAAGARQSANGNARVRSPASRSSARRRPAAASSGAALVLPLMLVYAAGLVWLVWQRQLPWWVLPASVTLNLAAFFAYWQDKYAAQQGRWRVQEATLHFWSLAGGWGGAWCAQQVLRHKSAKASFRAGYGSTVVVHCAAMFGAWWWFARGA